MCFCRWLPKDNKTGAVKFLDHPFRCNARHNAFCNTSHFAAAVVAKRMGKAGNNVFAVSRFQ